MKSYVLIGLAATIWLVLVVAQLWSPGPSYTVGQSDPLTDLFSTPSHWLEPLRKGLVSASSQLPSFGGQLLPGLAVGDTSLVSESLDDAMKSASLTHLVAVSGANCQVVTAAAFGLFSWIGAPRWLRIFGACVALGWFVALVTPGPSISRAAVMSLAVLTGMALGRLSAGIPALALSVIVLLVVHPPWATEYGFVLSVLATTGILTLTKPLSRIFEKYLDRWMAVALAVPIAAVTLCQPVIILLSPTLPTYGVLANILAVPAAAMTTVLGLVVALACALWIPLGTVFAWIAWLPAEWVGRTAVVLANFPFARLEWLSGGIGMAAAALVSALFIVAVISRYRRSRVVALAIAMVLVGASATWTISGATREVANVPRDWIIAACDVGQGDAFVLRGTNSDGKDEYALIDAGRSPTLVRDCLVRLRIEQLSLFVLTHFDVDHFGGAPVVFDKISRAVMGSPENNDDQRLWDRVCRAPTLCVQGTAGEFGRLGNATWRVMWPDGRSPGMQVGNPGSVSILVEWVNLKALFIGDLGAQAQEALLRQNIDIPVVDVLKVAHHGSRDTSSRLVQAVRPRIALVSVGADNGYGHPTTRALDMLAGVGAVIGRTDEQGMLFVSGGAASLRLTTDR